MTRKITEFRVAMRPGKRRALPEAPEGRLQDLIEKAEAHIRSKVEHPFQVIKQQFGSQKNPCTISVLAALSNLFQARRQLLFASLIRRLVYLNTSIQSQNQPKGAEHEPKNAFGKDLRYTSQPKARSCSLRTCKT